VWSGSAAVRGNKVRIGIRKMKAEKGIVPQGLGGGRDGAGGDAGGGRPGLARDS